MITDPLFYLLALPGVVFLGLAKGGFTGVGMIATPLLALYVPPLQAAAIYLPILLCQDAVSVWTYRRDWDAWNLKALLPGAVLGVAAAWAVAAYVSDSTVRLLVGFIAVGFVLNAWFGRAPHTKPTRAAGAFWGAGSGFTSTLIQAGSPPFHIFILPQKLDKMTLVSTSIIFFAAVNVMKVVPYLALGQLTTANMTTSLVLLPLAIATNFLGIWLVRVTPQDLFYALTYWIVLLIGVGLIGQGVVDLVGG